MATVLPNSDVSDTFSPGTHRFTDNSSDISSNWKVLQTNDQAHSQCATQYGGGDPALVCGLDTSIPNTIVPSVALQLSDSGGVPAGTVCKIWVFRADGLGALWTSSDISGIGWTNFTINTGDWGTFNVSGTADTIKVSFHFPSDPGGAYASISGTVLTVSFTTDYPQAGAASVTTTGATQKGDAKAVSGASIAMTGVATPSKGTSFVGAASIVMSGGAVVLWTLAVRVQTIYHKLSGGLTLKDYSAGGTTGHSRWTPSQTHELPEPSAAKTRFGRRTK